MQAVLARRTVDGGHEHYATTELVQDAFEVWLDGQLVMQTDRAAVLREYYDGRELAAVCYFPPAAMTGLETSMSASTSFCPIKGTATYLNYRDIPNAIWCYRDPIAGVAAIRATSTSRLRGSSLAPVGSLRQSGSRYVGAVRRDNER